MDQEFRIRRKNGEVVPIRASSMEEATAVIDQMDGVPAPIMQRGGGWNASIEAYRPNVLESFVDRGKEFVSNLAEIPGALVDMAKQTSPADPLRPVRNMASAIGKGIMESSARSAERQGGGMRSLLGAVPVAGPYVMDKVSDIEEGNLQKVVGETGFDIASLLLPGKMAAKVAPAKSVAGASPTLSMAERLGIRPKRAWGGMLDKPIYDPLKNAPGDPKQILAKGQALTNEELVKIGAAPVTDALTIDQLQSGARRNIGAVKDEALRKVDVAQGQERNLRDLIAQKDAVKLPEPAVPNLSAKFPSIDPSEAADPILARLKAGRTAATDALGKKVGAARLPFADVPMREEDLARIVDRFGASPEVKSAIGKLLWDGPVGEGTPRQILSAGAAARVPVQGATLPILGPSGSVVSRVPKRGAVPEMQGIGAGSIPPKVTFADVNAIYDELQKAPKTDLLARRAARELKDAAMAQLKAQNLDTSALEAANKTFRAEVGIPYRKGQPMRSLALEEAQKPVAALQIPLTEGRSWEALVKSLDDASQYGGAPAAAAEKAALRRTVANNNMGLAQGMDAFTKNWRTASPRMKKAVFAEDAAEIDKVIDLLDYSKKQAAWGETRAQMRSNALKDVQGNVVSMRDRMKAEAAAVQPTKDLTILDEVWSQYAPSKHITDSGLLPTSDIGIAALLARAEGHGRNGVRNFRIALEKAIKLGQPASLYNLVASTVREKKKENR